MTKKNKIKNFRKKFVKSRSIGGWLQLSDPNSARLISNSNYLDWICLDMEHGLINNSNIPNILNAIESSGKFIFARIPYSEISNISKLLDLGIDGIIIANIKSEKDVKEIFDLSNYPPKGKRGLGFSKYNEFRLNNDDIKISPVLVPMIENIISLKNLEKILKYKNKFDGLFIGPVDLSLSIGDNLKFESKYKKSLKEIKFLCKKYKVPLGMHLIKGNKKDLNKVFKSGFRFAAYLTDTVVLQNY